MGRLTEFRHLAMWVQACRAESVGEVRPGWNGRPVVHYTLSRAGMLRFRSDGAPHRVSTPRDVGPGMPRRIRGGGAPRMEWPPRRALHAESGGHAALPI